jgi:hypothetical protein
MDFGLYCVEQYIDLMKGLSQREQEEAEKKLKVTPQLFQKLRNLEEEQKESQTIEERIEEEPEDDAPIEEEIVEKKPFVYEPKFKKKEVAPMVKKPNRLAHLGYIPKKK